MARFYKIWGLISVVVIIALWTLLVGKSRVASPPPPKEQLNESKEKARALREHEMMLEAAGVAEEIGAKDAKVRVKAHLPPTECHAENVRMLKKLVAQYPGKLFVKFIAWGSAEAEKEGFHCATILVNGKSDFIIQGPKKELRNIVMLTKMNFSSADLEMVVKQEISKVYGKTAGG